MAKISKITTQKNSSDRYNIFLDDGQVDKFAFSVDEDVLIKFKLKKGLELDDFSILEISFHDEIRKAYNTAIHFLSRRMRTEAEVRNFLREKEYGDPVIQEVIHKLNDYKFLNDEDYAIAYVKTQMNTTDKGPQQIKRELKDKGIQNQLIVDALSLFFFDIEVEKANQIAIKLSQKKINESERLVKQRVEEHLRRKGYSSEAILIAVDGIDGNKAEDEEMSALRYQAEKAERKYANLEGYEYKQKIKQFLFRKGFSLDLIERYLKE